jgi:hypothetical protein
MDCRDKPGNDEVLWWGSPPPIPALQKTLTMHPPRPLRGVLMRRFVRRGEVRRLRALLALKHSGGAGAPSGTITSPRLEQADDLDVALPAFGLFERELRSWPRPQTRCPNRKAGPGAVKSPPWRAERRRVSRQDTCHIRIASFGTPSPHADEGRQSQTPDASRIAERTRHARTCSGHPMERCRCVRSVSSLRSIIGLPGHERASRSLHARGASARQ